MSPIVIAYYSRSGKTRMIAEKLAPLLDADLEEIRDAKDRSGVLGWLGAGRDAALGRSTELVSTHDVKERSVVVIGFPVWAGSPPPAIRTYVRAFDPAGRTVFAFCTHDGGGGRGAFRKLARILPSPIAETLDLKKPAGDKRLPERLAEFAAMIRAGGRTEATTQPAK